MMLSTDWNVATLLKCSTLVRTVAIALLTFAVSPVQAQITPDGTLGGELSTLTEGAMVRGDLANLIEGGAVRGGNLFHSFLEFNVGEGQRVYFASPVGIESILNRVTGDDPSTIFGTLGVDGSADLFLLNPNGLVFGENAVLDIEGSFYGSTGDAISLGDGVFSAVAPEQSQLLVVSPSVQLENYLTAASGNIENWGQLAAQGDLMLVANGLDLQGQIAAGGDLTLLALDRIQIRDAIEAPFIGFAGGDLLAQGNEQVDIVVLSHPDSGLYSYGDMVLRSANPVGGDAHYWSAGSFQVETLDGEIGDLYSPIDPVIRTFGDVAIAGYTGTSLHILAGGSVQIDLANITGPAAGAPNIDFLQETVELSDGTTVLVDGAAQPTLDVRAGILPETTGIPDFNFFPGLVFNPVFTAVPSSADIAIGDVLVDAPNALILLTNQYQPNFELPGGNIQIESQIAPLVGGGGIIVGNFTLDIPGSGEVFVDARNDIAVRNSVISTISIGDSGGDVVLLATGDVRFDNPDNRLAGVITGAPPTSTSQGGDIKITSANLFLSDGADLTTSTNGPGDAGDVIINTQNRAVFDGTGLTAFIVNGIPQEFSTRSGITSDTSLTATGNSGIIDISANSLEVLNGARVSASTSGQGNAGSVLITVEGNAVFDGTSPDGQFRSAAGSEVGLGATGAGGSVEISTNSLEVTNGATLTASTFGTGNAGNIFITVEDSAVFDGTDINGFSSNAVSEVGMEATGAGGTIDISANSLEVINGALIGARTFGRGNAGNVKITITDRMVIDGLSNNNGIRSTVASDVQADATGTGGNVEIFTNSLEVRNGAVLSAGTLGEGNAGDVVIRAEDRVIFNGTSENGQARSVATSEVGIGSTGMGGNVEISTNSLEVTNGAGLSASTFGEGDAGDVVINATEQVVFDGTSPDGQLRSVAGSEVGLDATGAGGSVEISTNSLEVANGAILSASTFGEGNAGDVVIDAEGQVIFDGTTPSGQFSSAATSEVGIAASGTGGNVEISANSLQMSNGAFLSAGTAGEGDAGDVLISTRDFVVLDGTTPNGQFVTGIISEVGISGTGAGGKVEIDTRQLGVANGALLSTATFGSGNAGDVVVMAQDSVVFDGTSPDKQFPTVARSSVGIDATGTGGNIEISANVLEVLNGATLVANTSGNGDAGNVLIEGRSQVNLQGASLLGSPSGIFTSSELLSTGQGGDIQVATPNLQVQEGAVIDAGTASSQAGGDIVLSLELLDVLNGGQVTTGSFEQGAAGTIQIEATKGIQIAGNDATFAERAIQFPLLAEFFSPQSTISVQSNAGGAAGNIVIGAAGMTPKIVLDDGGQIIAESAAVDGGNITLTLSDLLLLRDNSLISTTAGTAQAGGNGGNITITTPFTVAIPGEDSDIAADAFEGTGGNVSITAQGVFGIEPRAKRTPLSDITASSELGISGVVDFNVLDDSFIENSLTELSEEFVDTSALTAGSCIARSNNTESTFVVTVGEGLPQQLESTTSGYSIGTVQPVTADSATPIIQEPQWAYQLADGRLVLSHEC